MRAAARPLHAAAGLVLCAFAPAPIQEAPKGAACGPDEQGPAIRVHVTNLKDGRGVLRLEVYPAVEGEFLQDDYLLVRAGKVFRRVVVPTPDADPVEMCVRIPGPGAYALALIHARRNQQSFSPFADGIGFSNNPKLGLSKPKARQAAITAGPGITDISIAVNYLNGLSISPGHRR
jgi:uncharacterized protein (DUF2141 family)